MKIFHSTPLFNGLQVGRFDPFCWVMIRFERGTTTVLLQWIERPPLERGAAIQNTLPMVPTLRPTSRRSRSAPFWQAVRHCVGRRVIPLWPGCHKTGPMRSERHQCQLGVGALLGCRLLQPLHGFIFIHRHSVTIAIAHAKIVLSRSVAVTSR